MSTLHILIYRDELLDLIGDKDAKEPYRLLLKQLIHQTRTTRDWLKAQLDNQFFEIPPQTKLIRSKEQLRQPLEVCYRSLLENKLDLIANGNLLDTLRRLACFGVTLTKLDLRQESIRHTDALNEILSHILPNEEKYSQWNEEKRQEFLLQELASKRPLISHRQKWTTDTQEVLDTFEIIGRKDSEEALGTYIISMAGQPSDVLLVALFMKELSNSKTLPVRKRSRVILSLVLRFFFLRLRHCLKHWMIWIGQVMSLIDYYQLKGTEN